MTETSQDNMTGAPPR